MITLSWLCMKFWYIGGIVQVVPLKASNIIVNLILPYTFYFQILVMQTILNNERGITILKQPNTNSEPTPEKIYCKAF